MDASVTPIPDQPGTSLVQTTDFFYPLVDDPYLQVKAKDRKNISIILYYTYYIYYTPWTFD